MSWLAIVLPKKALVKDKRQPNLALLAAAQNRNKEAITPEQMKKLVKDLSGKNDIIIIDCPAGIELGFQNGHRPRKKKPSSSPPPKSLPCETPTGSSACWRPTM